MKIEKSELSNVVLVGRGEGRERIVG